MPVLFVFGAGFMGGLWVRSELDSGNIAGDLGRMALLGGGAYLAWKHFKG